MLYSLICALVGNSVTDDAAVLLIEIVQIAAVAVVFVNGNSFLCPSPEVNRLLIVIILVVTHLALKIQLFTYFPCHENIGITLIILKEVCNFNGKIYTRKTQFFCYVEIHQEAKLVLLLINRLSCGTLQPFNMGVSSDAPRPSIYHFYKNDWFLIDLTTISTKTNPFVPWHKLSGYLCIGKKSNLLVKRGALSGKMTTCPMIPLKKPTSPARWIQILPI
ncbi:hypothetical protein GQX74_013160 [Glossina fuscipes]|nr:hypothetical protein GQX74_013160 [Glossina fuscipes]